MSGWAIDFGTTHTRVARWDATAGQPRLLELPAICRKPQSAEPLEGPRLVPSATHVLPNPGLATRIGRWPLLARNLFLGKQALIGRPALDANEDQVHPNFAPTFKPFLEREALRPIARVGRHHYTAREVAQMFARELLSEVKAVTGERIRSAVLSAPVEAYETYRAELSQVVKRLGVRDARFVDEPVAAAMGYGLGLVHERLVLLVDFGGGTFHLAIAALAPGGVQQGSARILAKEGRAVGGSHVDRWLLAELGRRIGAPLDREPEDDRRRFWWRHLLHEARRVKEAVYFQPAAAFTVVPPPELTGFPVRVDGPDAPLSFTSEHLVQVLREHGLPALVAEAVDSLFAQPAVRGIAARDIQDVLLVGGSTLLPGVYAAFEERFGRDRVRAWQPFEAVVLGACAHSAGQVGAADFIVHDYAFLTYDAVTKEPQYTVVVPRGTRFPTATDLWKRSLVPTCALGEPERLFKLVICEIGRPSGEARKIVWDAQGRAHDVGTDAQKLGEGSPVVVPLNDGDPTLGRLDPAHAPSDRRPRLEISFGVNVDRWLCATVRDLLTRKLLMENHPVVRLL